MIKEVEEKPYKQLGKRIDLQKKLKEARAIEEGDD